MRCAARLRGQGKREIGALRRPAEKVNYRARQITGAAAEWFAAPGQEADIARAVPRRGYAGASRRLTTPASTNGHRAAVVRQIDPRPRIVLLQSLVGVNHHHVRMIMGMRSTHLCQGQITVKFARAGLLLPALTTTTPR